MSKNETKEIAMDDMTPARIAAIAAVSNRPEADAMTDEQFETAVKVHMIENAKIGYGPICW